MDRYVISLREFVPDTEAEVIVLEPWTLAPIPDAWPFPADPDLVIVTSPFAAQGLTDIASLYPRAQFYAPGRGTAAALHAHGVDLVMTPADETSDGLMMLPGLQDVAGMQALVLGAAGGRGIIQRELAQRGARVTDHFVYTRSKTTPNLQPWYALRETRAGVLLVSSLNALIALDEALNIADQRALRALQLIASSERIAQAVREMGFADVLMAGTPQPNEMLRLT